MATPHPDFAALAARCILVENDAAKLCTSMGFRFTALKYAHSEDLLSGHGAKISGGRINGIDTFPVIYTSTDPETAAAETFQNFAAFGFDKVRPMVVVGVELKLTAILDLCDAGLRRRLKVNLARLAEPWWPDQEAGQEAFTQAIGRAAYAAQFEAVMLPSARRRSGINLNVFPEKLRPGSSIKVLAEQDLRQYLK